MVLRYNGIEVKIMQMDATRKPHYDFHQEPWHSTSGQWLREVVFGVNDGLVATVGLIAGVTSSNMSTTGVLEAGFAAMGAATVAMSLGSYLSSKAEYDFQHSEIAREREEIAESTEHELGELRTIYTDMGFAIDEVEMIVNRARKNHDLCLRLMIRDELGIGDLEAESPVKNAVVMGVSVIAGSLPPILPFLFWPISTAFTVGLIVSGIAAFLLGVLKSRVAKSSWVKSGFSFFGLAAVSVVIGIGIGNIVPHFF